MKKWTRMNYQPNRPLYEDGYVTGSAAHIALSKEAAKEGMVLLKNNGVLPLAKNKGVALLGKGTFDYVKGGGGSGDVYCAYVRNLYEGVTGLGVSVCEQVAKFYREYVERSYAKGAVPGMIAEPALSEELLAQAAAFTDTAIVSISRFSGEGWDRSDVECNEEFNPWPHETSLPKEAAKIFPEGDFYLTKEEKALVAQAVKTFAKVVVVVNVGGMLDTRWIRENDGIGACLYAWQGGMEGGVAAAELLFGDGNPCGKLPDTFAGDLEDYPSTEGFHESFQYVNYHEDIYVGYRYFETIPGAAEKVVYPFGHGLSYTSFEKKFLDMTEGEAVKAGDFGSKDAAGRVGVGVLAPLCFEVEVTNVGNRAGKEVVALFAEAPQGKLGKASRSLVAFAKTRELQPGETQRVELTVDPYTFASYDDMGKVAEAAYVLEAGDYRFYLGGSVRDTVELDALYHVEEDTVLWQLEHRCAPVSLDKRMLADGSFELLPQGEERDLNVCVFEKMEAGTEEALEPIERGRGMHSLMNPYKEGVRPLADVVEGKMTMEEFVAQLSMEELIHLTGGQPNKGVSNTWGMGNLPEYGVPTAETADGPAGVRIHEDCGVATTAWPCATLLASTWNEELIDRVGRAGGEELKENNLQIWLTPAVNIHRNPMCGRNFEYYSEDPFLTGKIGAAMVRGIQSNNVACSVKHFAANNKETNRKHSDSRVSERALREIYLKQFEMIVREAKPWTIMSSYNALNGFRVSENRELLTGILREEWNYDGMVTSDWWTRGEHYKEVAAGNDIKMACGFPDRVAKALEMGAVSEDAIRVSAKRVLEMIVKLD
ncbi:beta-glucosidase [Lachnospiraceae bacterium XBD2001]|nr:beta-glucosidase [Lachnospiraceae bacterium XBD2001]